MHISQIKFNEPIVVPDVDSNGNKLLAKTQLSHKFPPDQETIAATLINYNISLKSGECG